MATLDGKPYPSAWICRKCGADISDDKIAIFLKLCPKCDGNLSPVDPQAAWSALKEARRANGIEPVYEVEPDLNYDDRPAFKVRRKDELMNESMRDQLRYEGEPW